MEELKVEAPDAEKIQIGQVVNIETPDGELLFFITKVEMVDTTDQHCRSWEATLEAKSCSGPITGGKA
jgi:hypothetical protein